MMKPRSQYGRTLSRHVALGAPAFGDGGPGLGEAVRAKPKETEEAQKTDTLVVKVEGFGASVGYKKPQTTTFRTRWAVRQLLADGTFKMSGKPISADSVFKTLAAVNNALTTVMPATPVAEADEGAMVAAAFDRQIEQDIPDYKARIAAMHERLDAILARE
jgi:hypothetical protein